MDSYEYSYNYLLDVVIHDGVYENEIFLINEIMIGIKKNKGCSPAFFSGLFKELLESVNGYSKLKYSDTNDADTLLIYSNGRHLLSIKNLIKEVDYGI